MFIDGEYFIVLWWGNEGILLNEDGTTENVRKPMYNKYIFNNDLYSVGGGSPLISYIGNGGSGGGYPLISWRWHNGNLFTK